MINFKNKYLILSILIIIIYFIPYFILGENFPMTIHDQLDSNIVWIKLTLENGNYLSLGKNLIKMFMGGIKQSCISFNFDISIFFFKILGYYWGMVANKVIMSIIAFLGMFLLLKKYFINQEIILFGVSLCFSLLPFWGNNITIAGMPILLYAFLNIKNKNDNKTDWFIIIFYTFYSYLITAAIFFIFFICVLFLIDLYKNKKINRKFLYSILLIVGLYFISHLPMFYAFIFNSKEEMHRIVMEKNDTSFNFAYSQFKNILLFGQYHAHSLHLYTFPALFIAMYFTLFNIKKYKIYWFLILTVLLTSLFYGFFNFKYINEFFKSIMQIIPIQLNRFYVLNPLFWMIIFAISLNVIYKNIKYGKIIVGFLILIELGYIISFHEIILNKKDATFNSFYAVNQFNKIKKQIGKNQSTYKTISIGIHPAVAQYNGFYTIDGYCANYPLKYKNYFREIIVKELDKNDILKNYFDNWGSRCYAFSSELGKAFEYNKNNNEQIENLDYNFDLLKKTGVQYIISAVSINQIKNKQIKLINIVQDNNSNWKIFLYKIN